MKKDAYKINITNVVIEEVQDALLLFDDNFIDSQMLDSEASFHTSTPHENMEKYIAGDYGKVYLIDEESLDIINMDDVFLKMSNESIWKI